MGLLSSWAPALCLLQYSWFLWLCCKLCVLLCWCLPWGSFSVGHPSFWFLPYWLLVADSLWGIIIDSLQAFLCSILKLRIQWAWFTPVPPNHLRSESKIAPLWDSLAFLGDFFFESVVASCEQSLLPSLGPRNTNNCCHSDLKSKKSIWWFSSSSSSF